MLRFLFISLIAASLLAPVIFRRQRRRAGLMPGALTPKFRKRLLITLSLSALLLVTGLTGVGLADNGDPSGAKTGISPTQVETVYPKDTGARDAIPTITTQQAKDQIGRAHV